MAPTAQPTGAGAPRLSVVTPLFNCLDHTRAMLASLQASMPPGITHEIILVDDGSTDGTREWIARLGDPHRVVLNESNLGFGAATNRGAAVARGEVLALLNNDLVLQEGWLPPMLEALAGLGDRAGLVGNVQLDASTLELDHAGIRINHKGKPEHDRRGAGPFSRLLHPVRSVVAVTGACIVATSAAWRRLGGFDEAYFNGCEDVDLCLRAREAGLANVVAVRSRVLHHVSSSPGRKLRDEENTRRLVRRWRPILASLGCRPWARDHFGRVIQDPRDFPDPLEAWRMAFYLARIRIGPPRTALEGINTAIDGELARWQAMFSH
jgi:GT2 family glycosyltransferase